MSRESRDGKRSHESDDDDRLNHEPDCYESAEEQASSESAESGQSYRHDPAHGHDRKRRPADDVQRSRENRSYDESGEDARRSGDDDADTPHADQSRHGSHDRSDEHPSHSPDPTKFATYDEDENSSSSESDDDDSNEPRERRSYRAEPAYRPHGDYRGPGRETAAGYRSVAQQTARRTTDPLPYSSNDSASRTDPSSAYVGSALNPYDHHRASLIGLSTALVAAIAVIVALMFNLSTHKDLVQSAQKDRQQYADRVTAAERSLTAAEQSQKVAESLAAQRAREAKLAADQAAENQRLVQAKEVAYQATQQELRRRQAAQQQSQEETQHKTYVTQIRLAKQAWDRGDTNDVLRLLEPYRSDPVQQKLRSFAWYYLWRAAHNGGSSTLRGHSDVVRQVAVTPDGSQIVTFGDDGQLFVWDAAMGRKLASVGLERNVPPRSAGLIVEDQLARHASGLVVASGGGWVASYGRNLYIGANIRQPDSVRPVTDHQSPIISLAMSADGKRLASGDYSGEIIVRDAADGRVLTRFHNPIPQALVLSNDGGVLFAGMHDGGLFAFDTNKGTPLGSRGFGDRINAMALSPDSSTLAVAMGVRDGVVRLWEPASGRFHGDLRGHHDEVLRVAWSRDGKCLLTASRDQTACLWSNTGSLLRTFRGHLGDVETVAFSPDGQKVISAGDDQSAILWNVDGGQPCDMLTDTPVDGWVSGLAFTPDASQVIGSGSCDGAGDSYEAFLTSWNLNDGNRPVPLQTTSRSGVALAFSPDGRQMAVGESSPPQSTVKSRVRIWSLDPARVLATVPKLVGSVYSVAYSNDGSMLAVGTGDMDERAPGSVQILEPSTGAVRQKLPDLPGKVEAVFSADGHLITVNSSKKRPAEIRVWNPATAQPVAQIINPAELDGLTTICLSPDGRYLVSGHGDPVNPTSAGKVKIKIWDLATRQLVGTLPATHPAAITRLEFSRRGMLLASGDWAGNVRIWDFAARKLLAKQIASQGKPITYITFDRLGERLAVAASENCLRVSHIDSGRQLAILELALGVPNVVRYTQDGKTLAAATSAGGLFLWDADTFRPRAILRGEGNPAGQQGHGGVMTCVAPLLADKLFTGSVDKTVRVWDLKARKAVAVAYNLNQAVSCMALAPNGNLLAVGTGKYRSKFETGELVICDASNRQPPKSISQGITPVSLSFSPDSNLLAVCTLSKAVGQAARTVSIIDLRTWRTMAIDSPMGHSVAFSPDGRIVAVGCTNGEIDLWPLDSPGNPKPYVVKKHQALVWSLAFSPDGKTLASGSADNNVVIWDVPTGEDLMTLKHNGIVEALQFSADGRLLASAAHEPSRGSVCLWRAPMDEEAVGSTPISPIGPAVLNRPASLDSGMAMRPTYPEPTMPAVRPTAPTYPATVLGGQAGPSDRGTDAIAPMPAGFARQNDDRYSTSPTPGLQPAAAQGPIVGGSGDPSVPMAAGGARSANGGSPNADGVTPNNGRANGGRRPRAGI
jgi:WD40 repeat protein